MKIGSATILRDYSAHHPWFLLRLPYNSFLAWLSLAFTGKMFLSRFFLFIRSQHSKGYPHSSQLTGTALFSKIYKLPGFKVRSLFLPEECPFFFRISTRLRKVYLTRLECCPWGQKKNLCFSLNFATRKVCSHGQITYLLWHSGPSSAKGRGNLDHLAWSLWGLSSTMEVKVILKLWKLCKIQSSFNL